MKKEIQPIRETKESIVQIDGDYLIISTLIATKEREKIRSVRVRKGKEETPLLIAGIRLNISELQKLKTELGEQELENIVQLALQEIAPDIKKDLAIALDKKEALLKKVEQLPSKPTILEAIDLSNIKENIKKLSQFIDVLPLDESSKGSIEKLKQKLEQKQEIRLQPEVKEIFQKMVELVNNLLILADLSQMANEKRAKEILDNFLKDDILTNENIAYFGKIVFKIRENKKDEALKMLLSMVFSIFARKNLKIREELFAAYIKPYVAICAGYIINQISSSRQTQDALSKNLKKWKQ